MKTLVLLSTIAFAGHVLAADWFSGTANNSDFDLVNAATNHPAEGVEVANSALSIDLPTGEVFQITPSDASAGANNGKTLVDVDDAVFTPTAVEDIDNSVVAGAQTALTVAYDDNNATNYYAYICGNWVKLSGADPVATAVDVTIELDYSSSEVTNASFKVGETTLYKADDSTKTSFQISGSQRALGHVELAGYGKIHSVTTTVEAVANVTVTPGDVRYGADFTNVTITAKLSGTGYSDPSMYTLTWNGTSVDAVATVSGDTLTITAPIVSPGARAPVTYAINVNGAAGMEPATTVIADDTEWITEDAGHQHTTGTWTDGNVAYDGNVATIADNTYTATTSSKGDKVIITFKNLTYAELCDLSVETPEGTQGAFALAEAGGVTNFYILAMENGYTWKATTCAGVAANTNIAYTIVMTFDYVSDTYSVSVSDGTNTGDLIVNSSSAFPLCVVKSEVTDFVFKGSGTMTGITGVDSLGYMAKDSAGNWYATIDAATKSGGKEFIVLRPTDPAAPAGWKFVAKDGITKLIKNVAKGMFFMAY